MNNQNNAKYAFYYLLSFAALIFTSVAVGLILFQIIDKSVPDIINNLNLVSSSTLRFAISALLIAAPVFYIMSHLIYRDLKNGRLATESPWRRWLTYFILLVSAIIILGVFISIVNNFLGGELTWRFVFKALTIFVIAAGVFSFYYLDLRHQDFRSANLFLRVYFFASLALVLAVFISAWFYVESPREARAQRLDQAEVTNLYNVESALNSYFNQNKKLPLTLSELSSSYYMPGSSTNDITYTRVSDTSFTLCANFLSDSRQNQGLAYPLGTPANFNYHASGKQCFPETLTLIPEIPSPATKLK